MLLTSLSPAVVPPRRRHFDPGVYNSPNGHRGGYATGPLRVRASGGKKKVPLAHHRWFCASATGEWIFFGLFANAPLNGYTHPTNPTTKLTTLTVGLIRASPGPFAYFFHRHGDGCGLYPGSHQDFVDGPWRLAMSKSRLSEIDIKIRSAESEHDNTGLTVLLAR